METGAQTVDGGHGTLLATVNGDSGQSVLRDGDDVAISLDGQEAVVDSVRWYIKLTTSTGMSKPRFLLTPCA